MEKARLERWHADGRAARLDGAGAAWAYGSAESPENH